MPTRSAPGSSSFGTAADAAAAADDATADDDSGADANGAARRSRCTAEAQPLGRADTEESGASLAGCSVAGATTSEARAGYTSGSLEGGVPS